MGEKRERNTGEFQGELILNSGYKGLGNAGECRGMSGECMGVDVNCQMNVGNAGNAGECQVNVWEWM